MQRNRADCMFIPMPNNTTSDAAQSQGALKLKQAAQYLGGLSIPTMHRLIARGLLKPNRSRGAPPGMKKQRVGRKSG